MVKKPNLGGGGGREPPPGGGDHTPRVKALTTRTGADIKLNPHVTPGSGIKPGPHWWKASVLTTAPSQLSFILNDDQDGGASYIREKSCGLYKSITLSITTMEIDIYDTNKVPYKRKE